jgi:hypothetical protein
MDKEMDRIAQDVKDIVQTRTAIADKLENLEHRFTSMWRRPRRWLRPSPTGRRLWPKIRLSP